MAEKSRIEQKIKVWYNKKGRTHTYGVGDGVHDGMYVSAHTKDKAMKTFKVIVAGSRGFNDYQLLKTKLDAILKDKLPGVAIISGTAAGADKLGERYASENNLECILMPADWDANGRAAGPMRNLQMALITDACICFWDGKSAGTLNMINHAKEKNLQLRVIHF